jgi:hypothetical protein
MYYTRMELPWLYSFTVLADPPHFVALKKFKKSALCAPRKY